MIYFHHDFLVKNYFTILVTNYPELVVLSARKQRVRVCCASKVFPLHALAEHLLQKMKIRLIFLGH